MGAESLTSSQSQTPSAEGPEPYQVIHVQLEEGIGDPIESRRNFEEGKSEQKRIAELAEREMRSISKLDAIIATQKAEAVRIADLKNQKTKHLRDCPNIACNVKVQVPLS